MECIPVDKNVFLIFCRISVDDVRLKLSSRSKNKQGVPKPSIEQSNEDSDEYELGKDIKDEKKRKA